MTEKWPSHLLARVLALCLCTVVGCELRAQDLRPFSNEKGKMGYANANGEIMIKCVYESAMPFKGDYALVVKGGKTGMINRDGRVIIPTKFTQITPWNNGMFLVRDEKEVGIMDANGKKVLPINYSMIIPWADGLYLVRTPKKKLGLIDDRGQVVLPANYSVLTMPNRFGKALIAIGGKPNKNFGGRLDGAKYGIINAEGEILIPAQHKGLYEFADSPMSVSTSLNHAPDNIPIRVDYRLGDYTDTLKTDCAYLAYNSVQSSINSGVLAADGTVLVKKGMYFVVYRPCENMVRYWNHRGKKNSFGYHNLETDKAFVVAEEKTKKRFETHKTQSFDFDAGLAPYKDKEGGWTLVNKEGLVVRSNFYALRRNIEAGLWAGMQADSTWSVFDNMGYDIAALSGCDDFLLPQQPGDQQVFVMKKDGKYGCVDRNGYTVIPFEYDKLWANSYDFIPARKDSLVGIFSAQGEPILPLKHTQLVLPTQRNTHLFWVFLPDSTWHIYNSQTHTTSTAGYYNVLNFVDGFAFAVPASFYNDTTYLAEHKKSLKDGLSKSKNVEAYNRFDYIPGCIINEDGICVTRSLLMAKDWPYVREAIIKKGATQLSPSEQKKLVMQLNGVQDFNISSTILESDWDY